MNTQNKTSFPIMAYSAEMLLSPTGASQEIELPTDIQWMPPGRSKIRATKGGEPVDIEVNSNEDAARLVKSALESYRALAQQGQGDSPYLDFNHNDEEAAGEVLDAYWKGDDPKSGGIWIRVRWSESGKKAIAGRAYRRFSPAFFTDKYGNLTGVPINMGGLVNRAAFQSINPVLSKQAGNSRSFDVLTKEDALEMVEVAIRKGVLNHEELEEHNRWVNAMLSDPFQAEVLLSKEGGNESPIQAATRESGCQLLTLAKSASEQTGVPLLNAISDLAKARPELYQQYREQFTQ